MADLVPPRPKADVQPTRKIAAILCADVVGYTRLMRDDDLATLNDIVQTRQVLAQQVRASGGRLIDTAGDSMLAELPSALEALRAAVAVQQELSLINAPRPESRRMRLRIGLNVGDVLEQDNALYGDGVNIAARLQALGDPGGVCVSAAIHDLVDGRLPLAFEYAGEQAVKNIDKPVGVYHARLGIELRATRAAPRPAAANGTALAQHPLPQVLSSFVGRDAEIAALQRLLSEHRLVTLVGPGGIGKTRLSLQAAAAAAGHFAAGVWFVELAPLSDARVVPQAVANVLGVKESISQSPEAALLAALQGPPQLIVLDNCEHLMQACADLARMLLTAAPQVSIMASSREPLRIGGEITFSVPVMTLPDAASAVTPQTLADAEATRLFIERARSAQPGFRLTQDNAPQIAHICRCLDGIPLAIELAAAKVRVLSIENIAARLHDRFRLLVRGDRSAMPRQQALRTMIDWSHDLLSPAECVVFRRLAVFAGGWTLEAAEAVVAGGEIAAAEVLELLAGLVEKSIVTAVNAGTRYRLLETMRQYALERLEVAGEGDATRDRHLGCYLALAEEARPHLSGADQALWLQRLDHERENFLAARGWCDHAEQGAETGLRLMFALKLYLHSRGLLMLLYRGTKEALARPGAERSTIERCRALHTVGQVCYFMGRYSEALPPLEEALAIARELGDRARVVMVLQELGMTALGLADNEGARRHLQAGLELARQGQDKRALATAVNAMAQLCRSFGELEQAAPLYTQALALARELQDGQNVAIALLNLAMVATGRGQSAQAVDLLIQAQGLATDLNSRSAGQCVLAVTSGLAAVQGDWRPAVLFAEAADAAAQNIQMYVDPADRAFLSPLRQRAEQALGETGFAAARAQACAWDHEQAAQAARDWLQGQAGAARADAGNSSVA